MQFKDILGHGRELEALKRMVTTERVAHAYLFSGPKGVGKRLAAMAFATLLNCEAPDGGEGCGVCRGCATVAAGTNLNVIELYPTDKDGERQEDGLIRIAQVRELQDALKYRVEAGKKVAVVDGADRLMPASANAFLKTLEEPPPDSVIILVTSKTSDLLPTILSRCQRVTFHPLPVEVVKGYLMTSSGLDPEEAAFTARLSAGSVATALAYAGSNAYRTRQEVAERLAGLGRGDTLGAIELAGDLARRDDLSEVLEFLKCRCRDMLLGLVGSGELAAAPGAEAPEGATPEGLLDSFTMIEQTRYDITPPRYANKQLAIESLVFRLVETGVLG